MKNWLQWNISKGYNRPRRIWERQFGETIEKPHDEMLRVFKNKEDGKIWWKFCVWDDTIPKWLTIFQGTAKNVYAAKTQGMKFYKFWEAFSDLNRREMIAIYKAAHWMEQVELMSNEERYHVFNS